MNDKEKLLLAIRQATPKKRPKIYLKGWDQAGYPQAPDDESTLPANALILELVDLQPTQAHMQAVANARVADNPLEAIKERLRNEATR